LSSSRYTDAYEREICSCWNVQSGLTLEGFLECCIAISQLESSKILHVTVSLRIGLQFFLGGSNGCCSCCSGFGLFFFLKKMKENLVTISHKANHVNQHVSLSWQATVYKSFSLICFQIGVLSRHNKFRYPGSLKEIVKWAILKSKIW
jgi:hypothetical protein